MQGGGNQTYGGRGRSKGGTNAAKTCHHCGHPSHTRSACWLLLGYPTNWEPKAATEKGKLGFSNQGRKRVEGDSGNVGRAAAWGRSGPESARWAAGPSGTKA
ncbi:hypothetical protein CRG98_022527 [Punica granatum]|uniref:CCHC-type domain-containing protein n=1 Tax=Punica granatum TaxID=22663 RepID=A0A2I0JM71_PUNGR|nr:hypothetical protein CRG98_022527 [Punica granatum]